MSWKEARAIHEAQQELQRIEKSREKVGLDETVMRLGLEGTALAGAQNRQRIDDQWETAKSPYVKQKMYSGERKMLYDLLAPDEDVESVIGGNFRKDTDRLHKHKGVAVATSKRVLFLDKGIFGSTETMDIAYRNIESVTHSTGMVNAGLQIRGLGAAGYSLEDIGEKTHVLTFADCVRSHMEAARQPTQQPDQAVATPSTALSATLDELERLANLVDRGFIDRAAFDAKKKELGWG